MIGGWNLEARTLRRPAIAAATAAAILGAAVGLALLIGAAVWDRATQRSVARLGGPALRPGHGSYSWQELASLPAPVARYFQFALSPGQLLIRRAHITQHGTFARRPNAWEPFTAAEDFSAGPPGFVWDARIGMTAGVPARVRDSYVSGVGTMRASVAGLVTVANQTGTPEMASGALLRYLAEAVWFPTALLPSQGVRWSAIDNRSARATLTDGATTVSMIASFASDGGIRTITAMRYRDVNGMPVLTPWEGHFSDYERVNGMRVPYRGEVGWMLSDGWFPYWRGTNVTWLFEFDAVGPRAETSIRTRPYLRP